MATPPRKPGRPPLDDNDPSVSVQIRIPGKRYDAVYERAARARLTVPEFVRRTIEKELKHDRDRRGGE